MPMGQIFSVYIIKKIACAIFLLRIIGHKLYINI